MSCSKCDTSHDQEYSCQSFNGASFSKRHGWGYHTTAACKGVKRGKGGQAQREGAPWQQQLRYAWFECGARDHMLRECPKREKLRCYNCGSHSHMVGNCPEPIDPDKVASAGIASLKCFNCDKAGHLVHACPDLKDYTRIFQRMGERRAGTSDPRPSTTRTVFPLKVKVPGKISTKHIADALEAVPSDP